MFGGVILQYLQEINAFLWGIPLLLLIIGLGIYLTIRTRCVQLRLLPRAIRRFFSLDKDTSDRHKASQRQALFTALAATVGTGNLAGVAGAISIGGPGSVFWMWVCGVIGMVTKYAEATLAVRFQHVNEQGETVGGTMYMIQNGMPKFTHWLAYVYCFFGVVAAFGVGNATQINAAIGSINSALQTFGIENSVWLNLLLGTIFAGLIFSSFWSGAGKVGKIAERLVPFASVIYLILGILVLLINHVNIPVAFTCIIQGAFHPRAVTGGMVGSMFAALRVGASRGVFTNEAGMGTAAIAHGSATVEYPAQQGLMGIVEVFIDTIVICTMTALVILCSGVQIPYGSDPGISLTSAAFSGVLGRWVSTVLAVMVCCFAIATVIGWGLYGGRCAQFLFGNGCWRKFVIIQTITVIVSAVLETGTVWVLAEIVNGLMAVPNLITLLWLSPELIRLTKSYCTKGKKSRHLL